MYAAYPNTARAGCLRAAAATSEGQSSNMDGYQLEAQEEMPYYTSGVVECWYAATIQ